MTLNELASAIAKREGKKKEVSIGDVREILKIIAELEIESLKNDEDGPLICMTKYISRKISKSKKKAKKSVKAKSK